MQRVPIDARLREALRELGDESGMYHPYTGIIAARELLALQGRDGEPGWLDRYYLHLPGEADNDDGEGGQK